jgi:hypothetical protein
LVCWGPSGRFAQSILEQDTCQILDQTAKITKILAKKRAYLLKVLSHLCHSFFANKATDDVFDFPKDGFGVGVLGVVVGTVKDRLRDGGVLLALS